MHLVCSPRQRVKELVLGAALGRDGCKTKTQGCLGLEEPFSRTERWGAFLGHWLGRPPVRVVGSPHFPETTIQYIHVIFHQAVLLVHPLTVV